jgi:tRNA threonylcarbamoyladenosine biosynthesis protein TsaE
MMKQYTLIKSDQRLILQDENSQDLPLTQLLQSSSSKIVAFYGKMGAGKTSLIKELCSELGTKDIVNSPTFSIVNIYDTESEKIFHFDCYRLNSITEALDLGIEDYFYSNHYCFIEWPENIETILPNDIIKITIEHSIDNTRKVTVC